MTREECLKKAQECVMGQREQDYGSPEDNFRKIANLWNAYLGFDNISDSHYDEICSMEPGLNLYISPKDVAMMMALMKIARTSGVNATDDCFVDLVVYSACGAEIQEKEEIDELFAKYRPDKKECNSFLESYSNISAHITLKSSKANVNPLDVVDHLTRNPTEMASLLANGELDFDDVAAYVDDAINEVKKEDEK